MSQLPEDIRIKIDEFLLKREDWKRKWESLPEDKKERFEHYVSDKMKQ